MTNALWEALQNELEKRIAPSLRPWADSVVAGQQSKDLAHYNDQFNSFIQMSSKLDGLQGRGNSPEAARQAAKLTQHKVLYETEIKRRD